MSPKWLSPVLASLVLALLPNQGWAQVGNPTPLAKRAQRFVSFNYADINNVIAGVAGGNLVVFVGEPLNGSVVVLSRVTGQQIGQLPPPPNGFVLSFIMHSLPQKIAAELVDHYAEDDLSEREIEVLREVSRGTSNKIIASHLSISEATVKAHMKNILLKLGASDRTHAVNIATTRGFLM
jgi:DNA-binding CsgD family transcriptional regulator